MKTKKMICFGTIKKFLKVQKLLFIFKIKYLKFRHDKKFKGEALNYFKKNKLKLLT